MARTRRTWAGRSVGTGALARVWSTAAATGRRCGGFRAGRGLGGQDDGDAGHARHGLERRLGRVADGGVEGGVGDGDLHRETGAVPGDGQPLGQAGGDQPLPRLRVEDGVEDGDDGGTVDQGGVLKLAGEDGCFYRRKAPAASVPLSRPLITLIAGPTASGKSRLALALAAQSGAVIVNADSQQLYADLRVLSARPSVEEEAQAEHRLYGVADAADAWSVGAGRGPSCRCWRTARRGTAGADRGRHGPVFHALTKGLADIPIFRSRRARRPARCIDTEGEAAFRLRLTAFDPPAAAAIAPGDRQRLTGPGRWRGRRTGPCRDWQASTTPLLEPRTYDRIVVEPDRAALYANCDARVALMVEQGALDEVRAWRRAAWIPSCPR
jgi:tRNA dimethylallyltransferase